MTLTLELPPELESRLADEAAASDTTPEQWLLDLAAWELQQREIEDAEDLEALRKAREESTGEYYTLDDLRRHIAAQRDHEQKQAA